MKHEEDVDAAMGNIEKIWGATSDQTLAIQANQVTDGGEPTTAIDVLCFQMESVR